jgi:hypothetical protein
MTVQAVTGEASHLKCRVSMATVGALLAGASIAHGLLRLRELTGPRSWVDRVNLVAGHGALVMVGLVVLIIGIRVRLGFQEQVRYLFTRRPAATALAIGMLLAGMVLFAVESAFEALAAREPRPEEIMSGTYTTEFFVDDPVLGYGPALGFRATATKQVDGVTIYDVVYTIDEQGRRVTPPPAVADGPMVLFFGDSNTFGEGVKDTETLPSYVAGLDRSATVLNYGFCGYGPQGMLAMLEDGRLDDVVRGRDVIGVYLFIDAHVARAIGSMVVTTTWGADMPQYVSSGDHDVERRGSFRTGRSWENWFFALASRYRTLTHFRGDLPPLRDPHFDLTARLLAESARELHARAASSRFYVVLHPHVLTADKLLPHLEGTGIEVLNYVGLYDRNDKDFMIDKDWHPTPLAYQTIAGALVRDLGLGAEESPSKP